MAIDFDEPRKSESDPSPESLDEIRAVPGAAGSDLDEADTAEGIELPGADLSISS